MIYEFLDKINEKPDSRIFWNLSYWQAVEFSKLVSSLRTDESEDVIVSACQKLIAFFHQRPDQKLVFVTQHGLLPLMELLEVPKTRVCLYGVIALVLQSLCTFNKL